MKGLKCIGLSFLYNVFMPFYDKCPRRTFHFRKEENCANFEKKTSAKSRGNMYVKRSFFCSFLALQIYLIGLSFLLFLISSFFHAICSYRKIVKKWLRKPWWGAMTLAKAAFPPWLTRRRKCRQQLRVNTFSIVARGKFVFVRFYELERIESWLIGCWLIDWWIDR